MRKPASTPFVPRVIRRLVQEKRDLTRSLFDRYQRINRADPNVAQGTHLIKEEIARVRRETAEEWKKVKWRRDVVKLEKVAPCPPGEFFRQLRDCFGGRNGEGAEDSFLLNNTDANREILRGSHLLPKGN